MKEISKENDCEKMGHFVSLMTETRTYLKITRHKNTWIKLTKGNIEI